MEPASPEPLLGTSSWSHDSWVGPFYPKGTAPGDYIRHYARLYPTVEIDATFYRIPAERTVTGWREKTPEGFVFAAKVPRAITHDKRLVGCEEELEQFLGVMEGLGDRLGPLLFQFPYFRKAEMDVPEFTRRLAQVLSRLPGRGWRFAVEVRNKSWVAPPLLDLLAGRCVALAWIDHPWFHGPEALAGLEKGITGPFLYVRWLGDRVAIEKQTKTWDRTRIDRSARLRVWARALRAGAAGHAPIFGYFNNHYAGYAIDSLETFRRIWREGGPGVADAG